MGRDAESSDPGEFAGRGGATGGRSGGKSVVVRRVSVGVCRWVGGCRGKWRGGQRASEGGEMGCQRTVLPFSCSNSTHSSVSRSARCRLAVNRRGP